MDMQQQNSNGGSIHNIANVKVVIDRELRKAGLAESVQLKFIHAPRLRCTEETPEKGCSDTKCAGHSDAAECHRSKKNGFNKSRHFYNVTFLICTSGSANEEFEYMPTGSQVTEVVRTGLLWIKARRCQQKTLW